MSRCTECEHDGYRYEFSQRRDNFNNAQNDCENGTLARYLDDDVYIKLRQCCANGIGYWIALVENSTCKSNVDELYTWIGNNTCTNANPLNVIQFPNRNQNVQAVFILLKLNNLTQPPDAFKTHTSFQLRYICQYSLVSPPIQTSSTAAGSTADTNSHSTVTATTSVGSTEAQTVSSTSPTTESRTQSPTVSTTNSTLTSTNPSSVPHVADSSALTAGLVVGGIILIVALVLLYFFFIRNGYYKKLKNVKNPNTFSFTPQNHAERNIKEVKENPLYGRVISTSESHQVCYGVNTDSVEINGSVSDPSNAYQMAEDTHSNEYHTIPGKPNNNFPNPSNEYEIDNLENDYNKLYFPKQQDDATSSTYRRLDHENRMPHKSSANVYSITT